METSLKDLLKYLILYIYSVLYSWEYFRRRTFFRLNWSGAVDPEKLSNSGFFFTGTRDQVECYTCCARLENWTEGDDPIKRHLLSSPECSFIRSLPVIGHLVERYSKEEREKTCVLQHMIKKLEEVIHRLKEELLKINRITDQTAHHEQLAKLRSEQRKRINDLLEENGQLKKVVEQLTLRNRNLETTIQEATTLQRRVEELSYKNEHLQGENHNWEIMLDALLQQLNYL